MKRLPKEDRRTMRCMKWLLFSTVAGLMATVHGLLAVQEGEEETKRITVEPEPDSVQVGSSFRVFFPDPMVEVGEIGGVSERPLLEIDPETKLEIIWRSQTEAAVRCLGPLRPGATYRLHLAPGATSVEGKTPGDPGWTLELPAPELTLKRSDGGDGEGGRRLERSGTLALVSNYPVRFADAAQVIRYRDVESGALVGANVVAAGDSGEGRHFTVEARQPLEAGRRWELLVEGLKDAETGTAAIAPIVIPAGQTRWLEVDWLGAFDLPLDSPRIIAKFSETLDPESVTPREVRVTPEPGKMSMDVTGREIRIDGAFDRNTRHVVELGTGITGGSGFGLAKPERWGATFRSREPNIMFPGQREVHVPTGRPLRFPLIQINTPELAWRLAEVPVEKLSVIRERLLEFQQGAVDPLTGEVQYLDADKMRHRQKQTELFVESFGLEVVSSGKLPASDGDAESDRLIEWTPDRPMRGAYLLETWFQRENGSITGNRALVFFGSRIVTEVVDRTQYAVRISRMEDGAAAVGATVSALSPEGIVLGKAVADETGLARFANPGKLFDAGARKGRFGNARLLVIEDQGGLVLEPITVGGYPLVSGETGQFHAAVITDRNVYRPGQTVKFYGISRESAYSGAPDLRTPRGRKIGWAVIREEEGDEVVSGEETMSRHGGWESEWVIPEGVALGTYSITVAPGGDGPVEYDTLASFQIQEYRPPLFTNTVQIEERLQGSESRLRLASRYFHGAPNTGATVRWRAVWRAIDGADDYFEEEPLEVTPEQYLRRDDWSEGAKEYPGIGEANGESVLDGSGAVELVCRQPFDDGMQRGRCEVTWKIEIVSPDGQTLNEQATQIVQVPEFYPGLSVSELPSGEEKNLRLRVAWVAFAPDNHPVPDVPARIEVWNVSTKTAKEQIAPFTFRYRNWPVYTKVTEREVRSGQGANAEEIPVPSAGDYVVVLNTKPGGLDWRVSDRETVSGMEAVEFPVENEIRFELEPDEERLWSPGERARFSVRAPFPGVAWVYVHTQRILDAFPVRLESNSAAIEIPVKPEYAPNVGVTVHLVQPATEGGMPMERVAFAKVRVARPDREMKIAHRLAAGRVEPGRNIEGTLQVTSGGKPVAGAELAVFAVDEAILSLGAWQEPDLPEHFFPERYCSLALGMNLARYVERFGGRESFEKGFIIGGGGMGMKGMTPKYARKEFKPLAYWKALVVTDRKGEYRYAFPAPDNLTTYRIVAVAQDGAERFACGSTKVEVSKPLIVEPALPRFVREGDRFQIRAVTRHSGEKPLALRVSCAVEGLEPLGPMEKRVEANPGEPVVVTFDARVPEGGKMATLSISSAPEDGSLAPDAAEIRIPVEPRSVLRKETVARKTSAASFEPAREIPESWKNAGGVMDITLSGSPWIAKLNGLPALLEYPHGCFEQTASRYLACSFLAELLQYLPQAETRRKNYEAVLRKGMRAWEESILPGGCLPMWPGGGVANPFVTAMAAWAVEEAARTGWEVPEELSLKLGNGLDAAARDKIPGQTVEPSTRAFALMVLALRGAEGGSYATIADDLYLKRDRMDDEARGFLAFAMSRFGVLPDRVTRLLAEIGKPVGERAFDPATFSSTTRAEAVNMLAFVENEKDFWNTEKARPMKERLLSLLDSSESLSTQENLWLLFAFRSLHRSGQYAPLKTKGLLPKADAISENKVSAGWFDVSFDRLSAAKIEGLSAKVERTVLMRAEFRRRESETGRDLRGFRIERVVTNLTDPARRGTPEHPMKLGDRLLVTYRVQTPRLHHYVALEDMLPAGLETVNPDLALFARSFELPEMTEASLLDLSHRELRDSTTNLYFDEIRPGSGTYSVIARATAVGEFVWPPAQIVPMYDSRFGGLSPSSVCHVSE